MQKQEVRYCLEQKMAVLERIAVNSETQLRFIRGRKLKGLQRLLTEREEMLGELASIVVDWGNEQVDDDQELQLLIQAIHAKQAEIVRCNTSAFQEAMAERHRIAGDIRRIRTLKNFQSCYVKRWVAGNGRYLAERI